MSSNDSTLNGDDEFCFIQNYIPKSESNDSSSGGWEILVEDLKLIEKFVQGKTELSSTPNLRLEYIYERLQLSTRKAEIIALMTFDAKNKIKSVLVKNNSKYYEKIHTMLGNNFILSGVSQQKGFMEYQYYMPPAGYKVSYTEPTVLWKAWWPNQRLGTRNKIQLSILVFMKNNWYPLQDIIISDGTFYIKTLVGQIVVGGNDKVAWVTPIPKHLEENIPEATSFQPQTSTAAAIKTESLSTPDKNYVKPEEKNSSYLTRRSQLNPETKTEHKPTPEFETNQEKMLRNLRSRAFQTMASYLVDGQTETITEVTRNPQGEIVTTKTTTVKKPCPQWVIEHFLNRNDLI